MHDKIPADVLAKYPVYYQPADDRLPEYWQDYSEVIQDNNFNYYLNVVEKSREFNPVLEEATMQRWAFPDIGHYTQNRLGFSISNKEFVGSGNPANKVAKESIRILLDDRSVPATYITETSEDGYVEYYVTFKDSGVWYQANQSRENSYLNKQDVRFKSYYP